MISSSGQLHSHIITMDIWEILPEKTLKIELIESPRTSIFLDLLLGSAVSICPKQAPLVLPENYHQERNFKKNKIS